MSIADFERIKTLEATVKDLMDRLAAVEIQLKSKPVEVKDRPILSVKKA